MALKQSTLILKENWNTKGFSLIEVILASSIFILLVTFFATAYLYGQENISLSGQRNRAVLLAEEGLEAVRNIRDGGTILNNGTYGIASSSGSWLFFGSADITNGFTRQIIISTIDSKRKNVSSTVTWQQNQQRNGTITLETYFNDWAKKAIGNWSAPSIESGYAFTPTPNGIAVMAVGDYAYVALVSGSPNFFIFNITDPAAPTLTGSLTLNTNLTSLYVVGNYAYIAGAGDSSELQIVNVTNKNAPTLVSTYNPSGNNDATGVWSDGTYAYLTRLVSGSAGQNEFYIINVADPLNPALVGSLNLENSAMDLDIRDNYAYITSTDNTREFQVIDISDKSNPNRLGILNIVGGSNSADAQSVVVNASSTVAFVSRLDSRIYPININAKNNPTFILSNGWSSGGNAYKLRLFNDETYLAVANNQIASELKIFDVTTPASPTSVSSLDIAGITNNFNPRDISYSPEYDRLLLVGTRLSSNSNQQLTIIKPQ